MAKKATRKKAAPKKATTKKETATEETQEATETKTEELKEVTESMKEKAHVSHFDEKGLDINALERQKKLAKVIGYAPNCMCESEYKWWKEYLKRHNEITFKGKDIFHMVNMHARLLKDRPKVSANPNKREESIKTLNKVVNNINVIYESYGEADKMDKS